MGNVIDQYYELILSNQVILLTLTLLFVIVAGILFLTGYLRLRNLRYLYRSALARKDLSVLEEILLNQADTEKNLARRVTALEEEMAQTRINALRYLQYCVLERYQAFKDVGGDQSFSFALLDARGDGIILTSIYGREESRIFAKRVTGWKSTHPLSEEERKALKTASEDSSAHWKDIGAVLAKK